MVSLKKGTSYAIILSLLLIAVGCSDSGTGPQPESFDATAILQNEANNVILATYVDLNTEAGKLESAVQKLKKNTTPANLKAARQQWRDTRVHWEQSEAFLFGPVEADQIDPHIDTWPLNKTDLDNVLSSNNDLTVDFIKSQNNGLKGFHTIEYLLFGSYNVDKTASDFTDRELSYLTAATGALEDATQTLVNGWSPDGKDWVGKLANAGNGSSQFASQKAAVEQLLSLDDGGAAGIADEVANSKIDDPFSQKNPKIVESQFSFNSKTDFQNNIRSIQHIYTGDYNGHNGPGITDFVSQKNAKLDARFKQEVQVAIKAIGNIKGNFRSAITKNRTSVEKAQQGVRKVRSTLINDIQPLVSNEF